MNKFIENLIGDEKVEFVPLWKLTIWDKKFNGVEREKQLKTLKFHYFLANDIKRLIKDDGDVKILTTNNTELFTYKDLVKDKSVNMEVVAIPWGGNVNIQYFNGEFITTDNRLCTSSDKSVLDNKFLYYFLLKNKKNIESFYRGSGIKHPEMAKILNLQLPVPPLQAQREIVRILDAFTLLTAELTARQKQYEYYRDKILSFDGLDKNGGGMS